MRHFFAAVAIFLGAVLGPAGAHDIPGESRIHAFAKPEGERLHVLLRVPLELLMNLDLPKRGGPGYLDLPHVETQLPRAIAAAAKDIVFLEDGRPLVLARGEARISLPSDRSFESYDRALQSIGGAKLAPDTDVFWNQGYFDAHLEYPIRSTQEDFSVDFRVSPGLRERLKLDLRYVAPDGAVRAFEINTASGVIPIDPRWHQAAWTFVKAGFEHILDGIDHLLFLLCLVAPFRRIGWTLVGVITSFTVAHSVTLISAAYGLVPSGSWFPPLVELLIAVSILYMAVENLLRPNLERRWLITFVFGLVHGFGFSFLLQAKLQFAGSHLLASLLAFNVGIELGQLLVLAIALPVLGWIGRRGRLPERALTLFVSVVVGHTAWHWMTERLEALRNVTWPEPEEWLKMAGYALPVLALIIGLAWFLRRRGSSPEPNQSGESMMRADFGSPNARIRDLWS
jgi:hypothetical protein